MGDSVQNHGDDAGVLNDGDENYRIDTELSVRSHRISIES